MHRRTILAAACGIAATPARAQGVPNRPITLIVPFGPGTVVDIMARAFADPLRQALPGQPGVIVVNREGAGGTIGAAAVAQSRPDGTVIAFAPSGMITTQPYIIAGLPYRFDAFEPICQTFENIFALAVPDRSPYRTLPALLEAARARPETISFGHAGAGTVGHLVVRQLELMAGVRLTEVGYRAGGQMMLDAQSGTLDMAATTWATIKDSGLRVLAVVADERQPAIPQVPTLSELGFPVTWRGFGGLWAPRGLPRPVAQQLEAACLEATRSAGYRTVMDNTAQVIAPLGAEAFGARLAAENREAAATVARLGLSAR